MNKRIDRFMSDPNFLGDHIFVKEPPRRCWQFQRFRDGEISWCPYGFILSYHPGCFSLWGDIGNLQINHYSAIDSNLEGSLHWLAFSSPEYLLSKSDADQVFSPEQSTEVIWQDMMERAVDDAKCYREIIREWIDDGKPEPRPERPEDVDGLFVELSDHIHGDYRSDEDRSYWRKDLKSSLESWLHDGEMAAYELAASVIDFSEPYEYIKRDWKDGTAEKLAAMQFGAREILVREFGRNPKAPDVPVERAA